MKALVFKQIKKMEYEEIPKPYIKNSEVLLRVRACGICSSDLDRYNFSGAYSYPLVLGHEISGEIVACGKDTDKKLLGKKAVVFPLLPCKECENCRNGNYAQCDNYSYFGSRNNGGFSEYLAVPTWNIKLFDESIDFDVAALTEPAAVAWHALSKIPDTTKELLIIGTGTIGIIIGFWAQLKGIEPIFVSRNNKKTEFLKSLGFKNIVNATENKKYDAVIECVGTNDSINSAINAVKTKGQIVLIGNPKADIQFSRNIYWKILRQEINISGIWNSTYEKDWDFVINNIKKIPVKKLITHKFKLEDASYAFDVLSDSETLRIKGIYIIE